MKSKRLNKTGVAPHGIWWLVAAAILLAGGCKRMPSRKEARALFNKRKATLEVIEKKLRAELESFPNAGPTNKCILQPGASMLMDYARCHTEYTELWKKALNAERAFEKRIRGFWLEIRGVKGVKGVIERMSPLGPFEKRLAGTQKPLHTWRVGCNISMRANKRGSTPPDSGFTAGKYRVGWGLGQLAFGTGGKHSYKDGSYFTQIDILWSFRYRELNVRVEAHLLATDNPPAAWHKAAMAYCRQGT